METPVLTVNLDERALAGMEAETVMWLIQQANFDLKIWGEVVCGAEGSRDTWSWLTSKNWFLYPEKGTWSNFSKAVMGGSLPGLVDLLSRTAGSILPD
jgi:hypothetical protein